MKKLLGNLASNETLLADPNSDVVAQQPEYAKNETRSRKPEMLITSGYLYTLRLFSYLSP